jgi:hypothetical protein
METFRHGLACGYKYIMKFVLVALWVEVSTTLTNDDGTPKLVVKQKHIDSYERQCDGIGAYCMDPLAAGRRFVGKIEIDGKMMCLALKHSTYAAKDAMKDGNVTRAVMILDYTYNSTNQAATHMENFRSGDLPPIVCHLNKPDDYTIQSESDLWTIMNDAMTSAKVYQPPVTDGDKEAVSEHEKDICDRFLRGDETLDDNDKEYAAVLVEKREAYNERKREKDRDNYRSNEEYRENKLNYQRERNRLLSQQNSKKLREQNKKSVQKYSKKRRLGGVCDSDTAKRKKEEWMLRSKQNSDGHVYPLTVPEIRGDGTYQCPRARKNMEWNGEFGFFTAI